MKHWADSMRACGVQSITTKEFSLSLDPLAPQPIPEVRSDDEEIDAEEFLPPPQKGMCKSCRKEPEGGMLPGLCRTCTGREIQGSMS